MSISQFGLAERSIADTAVKPRKGKTPSARLVIARNDRATAPEPR